MKSIFLLTLTTFIWGLGFVGTRWTLLDYSYTWSNGLRFVFAGGISLLFLLLKKRPIFNKGAFICAIALFCGLQSQTIGVGMTTLAKSGFFTTFYAIFTPLLGLIFLKMRFKLGYWVLLLIAFFGVALLCELKWEGFNLGDFYIMTSAFFFSIHILTTDKWGTAHDSAMEFNFYQCFYMGIFGIVLGLSVEGIPSFEPLLQWSSFSQPSSIYGFIILSIFSSLLAFSLQIQAQKGLSPHVASLIFLTESLFAAMFGYLIYDERLSQMAILGCLLMLLSVALIPRMTRFEKTA